MSQVAEQLQVEAKKNPVFKDVCLMLSQRRRTRSRLSVLRIMQVMENEGFKYSRQDISNVIEFMSKLGLGKLIKSKRGKIRGLSEVKYRIQSIADAALGEAKNLRPFQETKHYENITQPAKVRIKEESTTYPVFLSTMSGKKLIKLSGPLEINSKKLGEFILNFNDLESKV